MKLPNKTVSHHERRASWIQIDVCPNCNTQSTTSQPWHTDKKVVLSYVPCNECGDQKHAGYVQMLAEKGVGTDIPVDAANATKGLFRGETRRGFPKT